MNQDYTVLPLGPCEDGEVVVCPFCGKHGLLVEHNGKNFYNHNLAVYRATTNEDETGPTGLIDKSCPQDHLVRAIYEGLGLV